MKCPVCHGKRIIRTRSKQGDTTWISLVYCGRCAGWGVVQVRKSTGEVAR